MNTLREDLKAYIDHELPSDRQSEIERELEQDADAKREMEFMKLLGVEIRDGAVQPAVEGYDKTLRWLERATKKPQRTGFPIWQMLVATAGCLVLAAFLFPVFAQSKEAAMMTQVRADAGSAAAEDKAMAPSHGSAGEGGFGGGSGPGGAPAPRPNKPSVTPGVDKMKQSRGSGQSYFDDNMSISDGAPKSMNPSVPPSGGPGGPQLQRPLMIRTGDLSLKVENVQKAQTEATSLIEGMQGIVQSTNVTGGDDALGTASMTLRVPEVRFSTAMTALKRLGHVITESSNGEDVTTQVADTEARLKVMRVEEDQYVTLLKGTRRIGEILEVKERLGTVRQEIESLDAQRKALRSQSSYSTITLSMTEKVKADKPAAPASWSDDTLAAAKNLLSSIGVFLGQAAIYIGVLSPIWVPLGIGLWWARRRSRN